MTLLLVLGALQLLLLVPMLRGRGSRCAVCAHRGASGSVGGLRVHPACAIQAQRWPALIIDLDDGSTLVVVRS